MRGLSYGGACRADLRPARGRRAWPGPLLVLGGAGTGKTTALVERFACLAERQPPESLLALTLGKRRRRAARADRGPRSTVPYEELSVTTFGGLCARLLRDEALEAGIDPFATPVAAADRLAMLLERIDDLPLRHHDLRGNPSATLGAIVRRIDPLKDELISAADYARVGGGRCRRTRTARASASSRRCSPPTTGCSREAGALDVGDLVLQAFRLLREKPHVRARLAARYRARARRRAAGRELRPGPAAAAAGRRARRDHRVRRRRPGDPPLPRRGDQEHPRLPRRVAAGDGRAAGRSRSAPRGACWPRRGAVVAPIEDRLEKDADRRADAPAARSRSGAARPSARRRRRWRPTSSG